MGLVIQKKEAVKIIPVSEAFFVGFDPYVEKVKRAFLESGEEEETFWIKIDGDSQMKDGKKGEFAIGQKKKTVFC